MVRLCFGSQQLTIFTSVANLINILTIVNYDSRDVI